MMKTKNGLKQYTICILSVLSVSLLCYAAKDFIDYRTVSLLLLATVSILAIFFTIYPVLIAATLSALIWDFLFIPPHFTLHIDNAEDALTLLMYFIIALLNEVLTFKARQLDKLKMQKEERQNTIKLYKTLFDSISHELRTPISAIVGASDNLLGKNKNLSEENKLKLVNEISIAAFRLNRLIGNLLNMQRLESGFLGAKLDWCEINELINCPVNHLKEELSTHNLIIDIQENFPLIKVDFGLLEQAIFNLLHNATLYTPKDSTIIITCKFANETTTITIEDNGSGFKKDDLSKVFSKYFRPEDKKGGGTGLGLSIVKGFIEAHKGNIQVENILEGGARFTITIPTESYLISDYVDFSDKTIIQTSQHEPKN